MRQPLGLETVEICREVHVRQEGIRSTDHGSSDPRRIQSLTRVIFDESEITNRRRPGRWTEITLTRTRRHCLDDLAAGRDDARVSRCETTDAELLMQQ